MKNDVKLFIQGQEIEFSADPKILWNQKLTDLTNPTITHNSYTKQITVEGTPNNNNIFGHIWNLQRIQNYMPFNPIRKADFELYVGDSLFQRGYVKLDKVTATNNTTQYTFTLYGGLGSFFYNLSYYEDSNKRKSLADLSYAEGIGYAEPELNFNINKEAVYQAWGQIAGFGSTSNDRWNVVNFAPAYNGYPNDFDCSSVLVNLNGMTNEDGFFKSYTESGKTYMGVLNNGLNSEGFALGDMSEELTEWETRDLRSYLQRPVFRLKRFIQACQNPVNNGGWQVKLDSHFFHSTNPYYHNAWVTMPMLKDLDGAGEGKSYNITSASISTASTVQYGADIHTISFSGPSLVSINNVNMKVSVRFNPSTTTSATILYPYHTWNATNTATLQGSTYVKTFYSNGGVIMQMLAYGDNGQIVGQSDAYYLGSYPNYPYYDKQMWRDFYREDSEDLGVKPQFNYIEGFWKKINGEYVFVDANENPVDIDFSFQAPANFTSLVLKVKTPYGYWMKFAFSGQKGIMEENHSEGGVPLYTSKCIATTGHHTATDVLQQDRVMGNYYFTVTSMNGVAYEYNGLFSNSLITKEKLLTTEQTPADYLISYCKLFGLYFYYDPTEEASDTDLYPSGVIHIMDRDTFYTDEFVDLSQLIDWNKKMEITPALAQSKYYNFDYEYNESEAGEEYKQQYGRNYGSQLINTNYNFDNNTTELYDGNVFRSGVMVLEKDKYNKRTGDGLPVYQYNGLTYSLYNRSDGYSEFETMDFDFPVQTLLYKDPINVDYENYDTFPKLQLHQEENAGGDGSNILLFFRNGINVNTDYWLTDDTQEMATLNNGTPCWLMTKTETNANGSTIARKLNRLPFFTRDLILFDTYGNIVHSWNFGHPQVTYSPETFTTDGDSIYDKGWKKYINDLYSQDNRKLVCYVRMNYDGKPWSYWMRRFYWFENSMWRLNEIKDLNLGSFDTTKVEFIKVLDTDNYKLNRIEWQGENGLVLYDNAVGCSGGTISGKAILQGNGTWRATDHIWGYDIFENRYELDSEDVMSPYRGTGTTNFTITFPEYGGSTPITWNVILRDDFDSTQAMRAYVHQTPCIPENVLLLDIDRVACSGGTISGTMYMFTDDNWRVADYITGTDLSGNTHNLSANTIMNPYSGVGLTDTPFVLNVPENTVGSDIWWNLTTQDSKYSYSQSFWQPYCPPGESYIRLSGDTVSCSGGSINGEMVMGANAEWIANDLWCEDLSGVTHTLPKETVMVPYSGLGRTTTPFVITVPANTLSGMMVWNVDVNDTSGGTYSTTFYQPYCEDVPPSSISATPQSVSAYSSGRTYVFNLTCSGTVAGVTATTDVNWITASVNTTYNPTALTVVIAANNTFSGRMATVTIAGTGTQGPVSTSVQVTQNGKVAVTLTPSSQQVNKESGTVYYNYSVSGFTPGVDGHGFIGGTGNWIENRSGIAGNRIQVDYNTNNTGAERTGTVTYQGTRGATIYGASESAKATAYLVQSNQATSVPINTNKDILYFDYPSNKSDTFTVTTASGWTGTITDNS